MLWRGSSALVAVFEPLMILAAVFALAAAGAWWRVYQAASAPSREARVMRSLGNASLALVIALALAAAAVLVPSAIAVLL